MTYMTYTTYMTYVYVYMYTYIFRKLMFFIAWEIRFGNRATTIGWLRRFLKAWFLKSALVRWRLVKTTRNINATIRQEIELVNVGPEIFKLQWLLMNFLRQNLVSGSRWFDIWDKHLRGNFRENSSGLFMDGKDIEIYWNIGDNSRAIHNNMENLGESLRIYPTIVNMNGEVELGHSKHSQC